MLPFNGFLSCYCLIVLKNGAVNTLSDHERIRVPQLSITDVALHATPSPTPLRSNMVSIWFVSGGRRFERCIRGLGDAGVKSTRD